MELRREWNLQVVNRLLVELWKCGETSETKPRLETRFSRSASTFPSILTYNFQKPNNGLVVELH